MTARYRVISLAQLREPELASRTEMDDAGLQSLADDIRKNDVLQPLGVFAVDGDQFEIVYGHRRYHAARMAGLVVVPCMVWPNREGAEAKKLSENLEREELSPADEGVFFAQLYERNGQDVQLVAELVKKSPEYVERRLLLLRGDPAILEAVRAGQINVGVGEQFNRLKRAEDRTFYLDHAIRSGCTIRQARDWVNNANYRAEAAAAMAGQVDGQPANGAAGAPAAPLAPLYAGMAHPHEITSSRELARCFFCQELEEQHRMYRKFVCTPCADRNTEHMQQQPITAVDQAAFRTRGQ